MQIRQGQTRIVLLIGKWALKFPHILNGWRFFLLGLLANINERRWSGHDKRLCPVLWAFPMGFLLRMRRAELWPQDGSFPHMVGLPFLDPQVANFGMLDGEPVSLDYGTMIESIKCPDCGRWWDECEAFNEVINR